MGWRKYFILQMGNLIPERLNDSLKVSYKTMAESGSECRCSCPSSVQPSVVSSQKFDSTWFSLSKFPHHRVCTAFCYEENVMILFVICCCLSWDTAETTVHQYSGCSSPCARWFQDNSAQIVSTPILRSLFSTQNPHILYCSPKIYDPKKQTQTARRTHHGAIQNNKGSLVYYYLP